MLNFNSSKSLLVGRILSISAILIYALLGVAKFFMDEAKTAEQIAKLGIPESFGMTLLVIEIISVITYAIPRTAVLGAILLTGYMGGAIFTHLRVGEYNVTLQIFMGVLVWAGVYLRDQNLQKALPFRPTN